MFVRKVKPDYNRSMQQRVYHGKITPSDIARSLMGHFHRGNLRVQQIGHGDRIVIQIATAPHASSGGQTALAVQIVKHEDGVLIELGKQAWTGIAASLGITALAALRNPFSLLSRLDDLAQDIEYLQLSEEIWQVIDRTARSLGSSLQLSERLRRVRCEFCRVANPVGEPACIACGAPLGDVQPITCRRCGFVVEDGDPSCPNCGAILKVSVSKTS